MPTGIIGTITTPINKVYTIITSLREVVNIKEPDIKKIAVPKQLKRIIALNSYFL